MKLVIANIGVHQDNDVFEEFQRNVDEMFNSPHKDYEWHKKWFSYIESNRDINSGLKHALLLAIASHLSTYLKDKSSKSMVVDTLYVMQSESMGAIKIGRTWRNAGSRSKQLKVGCPDIKLIATFPNYGMFEAKVHASLMEFHAGGEWFSVDSERAIAAIIKIGDQP